MNPINNIKRTGLDEYLDVIFPNINFIHNKSLGTINGTKYLKRPDYRNEELKLIIEFDGIQHYTNPEKIIDDYNTNNLYKDLGYKVIRIPFFIQLSNKVVEKLFNVKINIKLFNEELPSFNKEANPSYFCLLGLKRMNKEFKEISQEQLKVNKDYLGKNFEEYFNIF